ncbi:MAG: Gfo/Idh/MocA family oxidoreductase [Bryobacterales bacterium]
MISRRNFAGAAAGAFAASSYAQISGANDRVRLGFIGVGNRGGNLLNMTKEFADQQVVAVCDLLDPLLDKAVASAGTNPERFKDFRRLLDRKDIDAVVIATPDHWHALMMIAAAQAGKDVYVEKPLSLTVVEGRRMVQVAEETKRVVQVGIHRRSSPFCQEATEIVRSGGIGQVTMARCGVALNTWPSGIGHPPDGPAPAGLDWDLYLGPAPEAPYNENRHLFLYRWFFDYAGGQLTDNGVHFLDLIHMGLGQNRPSSVAALGGKYALHDNSTVPDTFQALWEYPSGLMVNFFQSSCNSAPFSNTKPLLAEFRGTKGTMNIYFDSWEIVPEQVSSEPFPARGPLETDAARAYRSSMKPAMEARSGAGSADPRLHIRNFLDCIKSRNKPNCDIETAHRSTTTANIATIAYKTRNRLDWDADREMFSNDLSANELLHYPYRAPWKLG